MFDFLRVSCAFLVFTALSYPAEPAVAMRVADQERVSPDAKGAEKPAAIGGGTGFAQAGQKNDWNTSSQWLYDSFASRFADRSGDYQTAIKMMFKVARQSKQYDAYRYSFNLAIDVLAFAQAEKIARDWRDQFPRDDQAWLALIRVYLMDNRQAQAYREIRTLLDVDAGPRKIAQIARLLVYLQEGRQQLAILKKLSERFPKNPYLYYYLGLMAREQGEVTEAIGAFDRALRLDRNWRQLEMIQARTLADVGRLREAREIMDTLQQRYPDDPELISAEIDMLVDHCQWAAALSLAERWAKLDPQDDRIGQLIAWLYASSGAYEAARSAYQDLRANGSIDQDQYRFQVAQAAVSVGKYQAAVALLSEISAHSTLYMRARQQIAFTAFLQKDVPKALGAFAALRERFPEYALEMYLVEVSHLDRLGAHQEAAQILDEALGQYPNQVDILYALAAHQESIGKIADAEQTYRNILALDPANIDALNAYGYMLLNATKRKQEAEKMIREAIAQYPDSPAMQDSYAWMLYLKHQPREALIWLQRAYSAYRKGEIATHYVEVLYANGNKKLAQEVYGYERRRQPENTDLRDTGRRLGLDRNP